MSEKYSVGYGKPPKNTRFSPGRSGNPKGRPKGTKNLKSDLEEELREQVMVREGENERRISKQRAIVKTLFARASKGDTRAIRLVLEYTSRLLGVDEGAEPDDTLNQEELEVLENYRRHMLNDAQRRKPVRHRTRSSAPNSISKKGNS